MCGAQAGEEAVQATTAMDFLVEQPFSMTAQVRLGFY